LAGRGERSRVVAVSETTEPAMNNLAPRRPIAVALAVALLQLTGCESPEEKAARQYAVALEPYAAEVRKLRDAIEAGASTSEVIKRSLAADVEFDTAKPPSVDSDKGRKLFARARLVNQWSALVANNSAKGIRAAARGDGAAVGLADELRRAMAECKSECETFLKEYDAIR
jgi:hypothetical protein